MKLTIKNVKLAVTLFALPLFALVLLGTSARSTRAADDFDAAATFKAKCALCHGADGSKKFDPALADDVLVQTVLNGKDATPIKMPGYAAKGMTEDQAKAMVAYMKSLKK
ncbi:MAG TPA: cytochrome c [Pyrinomonadaceae bacterium]|jgi:mono/diheme cytochrome c family protein|nr:cytochrome c [Pyrinomonadaceae bacterium]